MNRSPFVLYLVFLFPLLLTLVQLLLGHQVNTGYVWTALAAFCLFLTFFLVKARRLKRPQDVDTQRIARWSALGAVIGGPLCVALLSWFGVTSADLFSYGFGLYALNKPRP